ncbi:hypothetical protein NDU88_000505 [Pleurodeles waltl]|uniref:Uncharacterized protein n=1 Tax=Pleurodeles waltl TaxID=8319 RepID=A0AAV7URW5_PLEWA|nr:hypothetical protein NDU88_000505 [Pleurodeles waltl]
MVAPSDFNKDMVAIDSEDEGEEQGTQSSEVEFVDSSGVVLRGTICGEASGDGKAGMAQVRLDFWQPGHGAYQSGCDSPHVLGGHEDYMATQRLGRPTGGKRLPVRVGAPFGHRIEGRAKPRAVHLTSRDAAGHGVGGQVTCPGTGVLPSTNQGAGLNLEHVEEELLDYEEEEEVHEVAVQTGGPVEMPKMNKRAVQGARLVGRHQKLVAGNLPRGEDYGLEPIRVGATKWGWVMQEKFWQGDGQSFGCWSWEGKC